MKTKSLLLSAICFFTLNMAIGQELPNSDDLISSVKTVFQKSYTGIGGYKSGSAEKAEINDETVTRWDSKFNMPGAAQTAIAYFPETDVSKMVVFFYAGKSADEANKFLTDLNAMLIRAVSNQFSAQKEYSWDFHNNIEYVLDFNSSTFADVQKHPSIVTGVAKDDDKFWVVMNIIEPYFKK